MTPTVMNEIDLPRPAVKGTPRDAKVERTLSYVEAVREATDQEMERDLSVILFGLDVDDPKAIQGTTRGLVEKYGAERVFGTPLSEDAMTGVAIGAALAGLRPIHVHIRMDFLMLSMNQLVNVAAKSSYMYGGRVKVPMVVRSMIGKSWVRGPSTRRDCIRSSCTYRVSRSSLQRRPTMPRVA